MDESATGSVNFFGLRRVASTARPSVRVGSIKHAMHLRMPSIDKGVQSFIWALVFFLYLFFGMKAIGVEGAVALVISLIAGFLIFLFVRTRGGDQTG